MSFLLQEPEIETDFRNRRENFLCSVHLNEIAFLVYQDQETVNIKLSHPYRMEIAVLVIVRFVVWDLL